MEREKKRSETSRRQKRTSTYPKGEEEEYLQVSSRGRCGTV